MPYIAEDREYETIASKGILQYHIERYVTESQFDPNTMELATPSPKQQADLEAMYPEEYREGEYIGKYASATAATDEQDSAQDVAAMPFNQVVEMVKAIDTLEDLAVLSALEGYKGIGKRRITVLRAIQSKRREMMELDS